MIKVKEIKKLTDAEKSELLVPQLEAIQKKINRLRLDKTGELKRLVLERVNLETKYKMLTGRDYF